MTKATPESERPESTPPDGPTAPRRRRATARRDASQLTGEAFESRSDIFSLDDLRAALDALGEQPGARDLVRLIRDVGLGSLQALSQRLLVASDEANVDEFGTDTALLDRLEPIAKWFHDHYFRVESRGLEHIPETGRGLLVANHSGTLPYDGMMVVTAIRFQHPSARRLRVLVENFMYHLPYLGIFMARVGAVRACQENALRLLQRDNLTLVFPEGVKGVGKLFKKRYRLQRFGRGGAVKLALTSGAPIIPVAIVGAEESMPLMSKVGWLAKPLGLPYIPVTPTLPLLGPLGLIPYPTKWFIDFAEPIDVTQYGPDAVNDRVLVNRLNEQVRATIQDMVNQRLATRKSVFFG